MIKLPSGVEINKLIDDLKIISWEASEILLYYSKILKKKENKSIILSNNEDPVTKADLKVNDLIIQRINQNYKNVNWKILSEENVKIELKSFDKESDWLWVLDPLDGTKDFIQGTGNYAMHLGLNYKQKPYLGVVLIPEKDELWISNGEKVWCERKGNNQVFPYLVKKKNIKVDDLTIVTSKNHRNQTLSNLIDKVGFKKVKVMGSIGCKIASIIRGESDVYISLSLPGKSAPKDWDFSAPEAILKAAGGAITNLDNEDLNYGKSHFQHGGIIVASNDLLIHESICLKIKEIIRKYDIYPNKI